MSEPIAREVSSPPTAACHDVPATPPIEKMAHAPESPARLAAPPGYEILCEIGQGGMGVVYLARDGSFDRPVALKFLQDRYAGDPAAAARFLYEARITGRLQHPGIPPVHQVGTLSDGRPFLAMKLIQGRTLADLLKEQGPGAGRWLAVFEPVCQAMAYAHAQGVIHRDLKPANVMVGAFGEVQVMDWGLAKVLARQQEYPEPGLVDPYATAPPAGALEDRPVGVEPTRAGSILGTPAFMPPEQAIGAIDRLDHRSDVFGLGAILCVLLTGKPPYVAADSESTRQLAARAKLDDAFARLDGCDAEPDLIALARRCLAAEPDDRPADAGVLAEAVAELRHQAEERARQAEMEQARAEVRAGEQRKRRRLLLGAATGLIVVLLAGIVGTTAGLIWADQARRDEEKQRAEAEKARDQAKQRYLLALDAFNQMVFGIQNNLENRPGTQDLRKELLENARRGLRKLLEEAERQGTPDSTLVWSHFRMGDVEQILGNTQAAEKEYRAGHELAQRLAQDDPKNAQAQRDLSVSYIKLGDVTLRLGQTKPALDYYQKSLEVRHKLAQDDPRNAQAQRDLSVSYEKLGDVTLRLGQTKQALEFYQKSLEGLHKLAQDDPKNAQTQRDLSLSYIKLGDVTLQRGQTKPALDYYQKSLEVSLKLAQDDPRNAQAQRDLSVSYEKLGDVTRQLGQTKQALDYYQKSLEVRLKLAQDDPKNAQAQRDLSLSYEKLGDVTLQLGQTRPALDYYQKSLEGLQKLAQDDPKNAQAQRDLSVSYDKLGDVTLQLGQTKQALDHYQKALEVSHKLAQDDPRNAQAQRDLSISYIKLGDVTLQLGQTKQALEFYQKSLEGLQKLAQDDPKNAQAQRDLSINYGKLGDVTRQLGQTKQALDYYQKSLEGLQKLAQDDPKNVQAQRDLSVSYNKLGDVTLQLGQTRPALDYYQKSLEGLQKLAQDDPKNAQAQRDLSVSYDRLGDVTLRLGQTKQALDYYQKSLEGLQKLAQDDPRNAQTQTDLFVSYWKLGSADQGQHEYARAADWFGKGRAVLLPLQEKDLLVGQARNYLALVDRSLALCKNAEKAIAHLDFVFEQKPDQVAVLLDIRVRALLKQGKLADAVTTAHRWAEWTEKQEKGRDALRYDAACAIALCAAASETKEMDALTLKVVARLTKLRDAGYFKDAKRLAHFEKDADFAGLREHTAFKSFAASLFRSPKEK